MDKLKIRGYCSKQGNDYYAAIPCIGLLKKNISPHSALEDIVNALKEINILPKLEITEGNGFTVEDENDQIMNYIIKNNSKPMTIIHE